jgi:hypothetical protein
MRWDGNYSDPEWKKVKSGIRDTHPGCNTVKIINKVVFFPSENEQLRSNFQNLLSEKTFLPKWRLGLTGLRYKIHSCGLHIPEKKDDSS